jgi:hypothetical protein
MNSDSVPGTISDPEWLQKTHQYGGECVDERMPNAWRFVSQVLFVYLLPCCFYRLLASMKCDPVTGGGGN